MKELINIKALMMDGKQSAVLLVIDAKAEWQEILDAVSKKFDETASFWGNAQKAIAFKGRRLTQQQQQELINQIHLHSKLSIICVLEKDTKYAAKPVPSASLTAGTASLISDALPKTEQEVASVSTQNDGGFLFKGNLRSGQVLDVDSSVVILGDVNNGANVVSSGSVIVLGSLKGCVHAGSAGNVDAFVIALDMNPLQIRIADSIARSPDHPKKAEMKQVKIAFWEDGNIYIEPYNKDILRDIRLC